MSNISIEKIMEAGRLAARSVAATAEAGRLPEVDDSGFDPDGDEGNPDIPLGKEKTHGHDSD